MLSKCRGQLLTIVTKHQNDVLTQMRYDHFNPYGLRKGSATNAVSGTEHTPSLPSMIARRGEWSQGLVLDVYWHFAATCDHHLGCILACFPMALVLLHCHLILTLQIPLTISKRKGECKCFMDHFLPVVKTSPAIPLTCSFDALHVCFIMFATWWAWW